MSKQLWYFPTNAQRNIIKCMFVYHVDEIFTCTADEMLLWDKGKSTNFELHKQKSEYNLITNRRYKVIKIYFLFFVIFIFAKDVNMFVMIWKKNKRGKYSNFLGNELILLCKKTYCQKKEQIMKQFEIKPLIWLNLTLRREHVIFLKHWVNYKCLVHLVESLLIWKYTSSTKHVVIKFQLLSKIHTYIGYHLTENFKSVTFTGWSL